ncbi:MAG: PAS domain-containing sensor histidine kinase [Candidatus Bathyarchaeia archaeon]|jgi:PAS domain S-box-containing protein
MVELSGYSTKLKKSKPTSKKSSNKEASKTAEACRYRTLSREMLGAILENIPSAVMVIEKPKGKIVFVNHRTIELHGVNPCGVEFEKHAKDLKIFDLNPDLYPTKELYTYRALNKGETIRNLPITIERLNDHKRLTVNVSTKPLFDSEGKINAAVTIFDDVTERIQTQNELEESEKRLKWAQRIAHVGNWEYYIKEDKAVWSEELFRIFGLIPQQYGPNVNEYISKIHPDDREVIDKKSRELLFEGKKKASFDYRIIRQDGSIRIIHSERMVKAIGQDNKPVRIDGVEQDITESKQAEQKLAEYAKNLELLVEERTKQLKAAERLAAIGQTAGMIGHDIRNPLQAIAGDLFLMKQEVDGSPDSDCKRNVQESLRSIQEQIDYINKIVSDLQDYSRPLKPELTDIDLCATIPKLLSTVPLPQNIEAYAVCSKGLPKLRLDITFLKRVLVNLVTNSIQAMPNGGKITIRTFEKKDAVCISVEDTGVGIPEEVKPKLFQPLMTTKSKGQGFGLAVVKRLVEKLGGKINVESEEGKGTKFTVEFPLNIE